jgi:hypothetical protein
VNQDGMFLFAVKSITRKTPRVMQIFHVYAVMRRLICSASEIKKRFILRFRAFYLGERAGVEKDQKYFQSDATELDASSNARSSN